jgi:thiamine biosynthesis lipoprotein
MGSGVEGSLLSDLNARAPDEYVTIEDRDFYRVLTLALDYAQFTHGAYDPTVAPLERLYSRPTGRPPTPAELAVVRESVGWDKVTVAPEARAVRFRHPAVALDLDVVVRGFALDAASRVFARSGSRAGLLRLGGVAVAWRAPPGQTEWSVPIADPRAAGRTLLTLSVSNRDLAVVGLDPTRVADLLDARTGMPASSDLLAVVALADSAADANALATALYVMGSHPAGDLLARMNRSEAVLLTEGNGEPTLLVSSSLRGKVTLSEDLATEVSGRVRYILPPDEIEVKLPGS